MKILNVKKFKGNANHVSQDQLTYVVNNSKLAYPLKVPLTKIPFLIRHNVTKLNM